VFFLQVLQFPPPIKLTQGNQGNTRGASNLNVITTNANLCSTNSFSYNSIRDWNSLPISIKNVTNKEAFKNAVKEFFLI
jgi:hypothetical protein